MLEENGLTTEPMRRTTQLDFAVEALRNAILDATGCAFYQIPMTQQRLVAKFKEEGLI